MKNEARHWDEISREREARKAGAFRALDQTDLSRDMTMGMLREVERLRPTGSGGDALDRYPVRPMRHKIFARRRSAFEAVKAAGLVVPELLDRPRGQQTGVLYDVVAVGPGVTSVRMGDVVVANALHGRDMGDILGPDIWELQVDIEYVDPRTHEDERDLATGRRFQRRMSDTERQSWGHVLAVLDTGP